MSEKTNIKPISDRTNKKAIEILKDKGLIAFPTETVYGIGGDATSDKAVASIFSIKGRPQFNPLISHVDKISDLEKYGSPTKLAYKIAENFWPGPLTMVIERHENSKISYLCSAGLESIAIRIPDNKNLLKILSEFGRPIAAPSANRSGKVSPTLPTHVYEEFGNELKLIIDGGPTQKGIESTVIDVRNESLKILRPGPITSEMIENITKVKPKIEYFSSSPESPGMLKKHYSPNAKIILNSPLTDCIDAFLGYGGHSPPKNFKGDYLNLSKKGDLEEAASNLFKMLRILDKKNPNVIYVSPIPQYGIGEAINDRLLRASED